MQALPQLADDLDADRRKLGGQAHQIVAVDAQRRDVAARHHRRGARRIGEAAELADDPVMAERRHVDQPGRDLDKDVDLTVEDHQGEGPLLALPHDPFIGGEGDDAAARRDTAQCRRIEAGKDRVQRQDPGNLIDRRRIHRALLRNCHADAFITGEYR